MAGENVLKRFERLDVTTDLLPDQIGYHLQQLADIEWFFDACIGFANAGNGVQAVGC